jgi:hypothetical protein
MAAAMNNVRSKDDRKSTGAQAALWVYAFAGLLALFPSAMTDEMSLALMLSFVVLYVVGYSSSMPSASATEVRCWHQLPPPRSWSSSFRPW